MILAIAVGRTVFGVAQREVLDLILKPDARRALAAVLQSAFVGFTDLTTWLIVAGLALLVLGFLLSEASAMRTLRSRSSGAQPDTLIHAVGTRRVGFALGGVAAALIVVVMFERITWSALILVGLVLVVYEVAVAWAATNVTRSAGGGGGGGVVTNPPASAAASPS